jgi:hypothetical protein
MVVAVMFALRGGLFDSTLHNGHLASQAFRPSSRMPISPHITQLTNTVIYEAVSRGEKSESDAALQ